TLFRRLLVEIYENLTFTLVQRIRHGEKRDVESARAELARIGARAVKPLLDALADNDRGQQRVAIDGLGYIENKNASSALFAFATGNAETELRSRAMLACGALRDDKLTPKYTALLLPKEGDPPSDAIAVAATWGLARVRDKRAVSALRTLV